MALTAASEWRRYWPVALASAVGFSFMAFLTPALGVFMGPLAKDFGWSRTLLSLGQAGAAALSVIGAPLVGAALDRWSAPRIALPGIVLTAVAICAFALADGSAVQWIGPWLAWGTASPLVQSVIWSAAISSVFSAGRGLALGITLSGTAAAQVIAPPLANWLIETRGCRAAFLWLGTVWGAIALLLCVPFLYDARDQRRLRVERDGSAPTPDLPGLTIAQAWRSSALWRIGLSSFIVFLVTVAILIHQLPILTEAGTSRDTTAWLVSLAGFAGILGKIVTGALIYRVHARWIGAPTLASTDLAYPLLLIAGAAGSIIGGILILSLGRYPDWPAPVPEAGAAGTVVPAQ